MSAAIGQYVAGRIDVDELERRLERELLHEVGRHHPVPPGWDPLPPCEHDWIDITGMGDRSRHHICALCGDEVQGDSPSDATGKLAHNTPLGT